MATSGKWVLRHRVVLATDLTECQRYCRRQQECNPLALDSIVTSNGESKDGVDAMASTSFEAATHSTIQWVWVTCCRRQPTHTCAPKIILQTRTLQIKLKTFTFHWPEVMYYSSKSPKFCTVSFSLFSGVMTLACSIRRCSSDLCVEEVQIHQIYLFFSRRNGDSLHRPYLWEATSLLAFSDPTAQLETDLLTLTIGCGWIKDQRKDKGTLLHSAFAKRTPEQPFVTSHFPLVQYLTLGACICPSQWYSTQLLARLLFVSPGRSIKFGLDYLNRRMWIGIRKMYFK